MSDTPNEPPVDGPELEPVAAAAAQPAATVGDAELAPMTGRIAPVDLNEEIQRSYLDYAMSVIVGRALPDVRDGLKPVHRRVLYTMYDGGYRPDRGWNKCSRVVGDVMGKYHPHGDSAIYDTLVRLAQLGDAAQAGRRPGQLRFAGQRRRRRHAVHRVQDGPLAMEMVRDIDQNTVDFQPNYDNKDTEPVVLPARFPNLLVNGSTGIAVGMATNIPPHNLREVNDAVQWMLSNPRRRRRRSSRRAIARIKGPDFPNGALIVGRKGIEDAYRTGRGLVTMRAVIDIEEDSKGRTSLVVTQLPHMCNPDNLATKIAELVNSGQAHRHRRHPRRHLGPYRAAARHRAEARRPAARRDEQPVQAHAAAGHVRLQHAGPGRRRAPDAAHRPVPRLLAASPDAGHRATHPVPARRPGEEGPPGSRPGQGAQHAGRGHRLDPREPHRRDRPRGPDGTARHRRAAGQRTSSASSCVGWPRWRSRRSSTGWPRWRPRSPT
jgi:hypothetical protein